MKSELSELKIPKSETEAKTKLMQLRLRAYDKCLHLGFKAGDELLGEIEEIIDAADSADIRTKAIKGGEKDIYDAANEIILKIPDVYKRMKKVI